jgi:diguanylate cyclase (GGDEF)-like protein
MPRSPFRFRSHGAPGGAPPAASRALATHLMRVIFGCYVVVAVALTGVQMAIEYRRASDRLQDDVAAMQRTFSPGLEDALWRYNAAVLGGILTGMKEIPVVLGVEVRGERGERVRALGTVTGAQGQAVRVDAEGRESPVTPGFGRPFSRTFALMHTERDGQIFPVGSWTLHSDDAIALDQVKNTLVVILINAMLKSFVLALIFFVVIRHMVGQPLSQISRFLAQIDANNLGARPLRLSTGGRHEFHALTDTLNGMARRLRRAFADNAHLMDELRAVNASLQARVEERTRELERLAHTDLLTGLDNRRRLDAALEACAIQARADGAPFSVILADVDHFKAINDRHGHKVGDRVLVALAGTLSDGVRPGDTLGRWGGEEFMIVCPGTGLAQARALAEALCHRIAKTPLPLTGPQTCSFGVAESRIGESPDSLVTRADGALYRCKSNGRNHVETQSGPQDRERGAA